MQKGNFSRKNKGGRRKCRVMWCEMNDKLVTSLEDITSVQMPLFANRVIKRAYEILRVRITNNAHIVKRLTFPIVFTAKSNRETMKKHTCAHF